jgi:hypothetical protein
MTTLDHMERVRKMAAAAAGPAAPHCSLDRCRCPTCATTELLLRTALIRRGVRQEDTKRVALRAFDCGSAAYPYLASVRVDGREVYRVEQRPDEVFAPEVLDDITKALRRPM